MVQDTKSAITTNAQKYLKVSVRPCIDPCLSVSSSVATIDSTIFLSNHAHAPTC